MSGLIFGAILIIAIGYVFWRMWKWSITPRDCWHDVPSDRKPNVERAFMRARKLKNGDNNAR